MKKKAQKAPPEPFERVDAARLDEAVLAILDYNECVAGGAWKSLPWDATDRLSESGLISEPAKARKSVDLYEDGFQRGREAFERLFTLKTG